MQVPRLRGVVLSISTIANRLALYQYVFIEKHQEKKLLKIDNFLNGGLYEHSNP